MSQKELQRVEVISRCVQGNLACARAAELLDLTPRHVKRVLGSVAEEIFRRSPLPVLTIGPKVPTAPMKTGNSIAFSLPQISVQSR